MLNILWRPDLVSRCIFRSAHGAASLGVSKEVHLLVDEDDEGMRLDRFLRLKLHLPQSFVVRSLRKKKVSLRRSIEREFIHVSHPRLTPKFSILPHDTITVESLSRTHLPFHQIDEPPASNSNTLPNQPEWQMLHSTFKQQILHENDAVVVLNKPAGLVSQGPFPSISALLPYLHNSHPRPLSLVHRLDKWTSGVLLLAKTRKDTAMLSQLLKQQKVEKVYLAVVIGKPLSPHGLVRAPIYPATCHTSTTSPTNADERGREAQSEYMVLRSCRKNEIHYSLLMMKPLSGRKHQLRVHCSQVLDSPILGDTIYDRECTPRKNSLVDPQGKLYLHAYSLAYRVEGYKSDKNGCKIGKEYSWRAPLPPHFTKLFDQFRWDAKQLEKALEDALSVHK